MQTIKNSTVVSAATAQQGNQAKTTQDTYEETIRAGNSKIRRTRGMPVGGYHAGSFPSDK